MHKTNQPLSPWIQQLDLRPHVEGGWFREVWRTSTMIPQSALSSEYSGDRSSATSVYFVLHPGEESAWHKVLSDELWLWHAGGPLLLTMAGSGDQPGEEESLVVGMDITEGQTPQALVPAGVWQMARVLGNEPVLVTCIVSPGFHFDDFTLI